MFDLLEPISLHPFQQDAIWASNQYAFDGEGQHVLELPTGAGKTVLALALIQQIVKSGGNALFLAPRKDLVAQTWRTAIKHFFHDWQVGRIQGDYHEPDRPLTIATVQSLTTNPERLDDYLKQQRRRCSIIVGDECHYSVSPTWMQVLERCFQPGDGRLVGLSSTPYRSDNRSLEIVFPHGVVYSIDFLDLILAGYLVKVDAYDMPTSADYSDIDVDEQVEEASQRQSQSDAHQVAYESWMQLARGKRTMYFAQSLDDLYRYQEYWQTKGYEVQVITGSTPDEVREEQYNRLRRGELLHIAGYNVLTTGLDIVEIECIIMGRATNFRGLFTQMVGRGLRLAPHIGKDRLILINLTDKHHTLLTMQKLIGVKDITRPVSVKRVLEEKMEEEVGEEQQPRTPAQMLDRLREIHAYTGDVFGGGGWRRDRMTNDYVKDYGELGVLRAERCFTGYHVVHYQKLTRKNGEVAQVRPQRVTTEPLAADIAMARGHQFIERQRLSQDAKTAHKEAHQSLLDGTSADGHLPITPGQVDYLKKRRFFSKDDLKGMKRSDYAAVVNFLNAHGSVHAKDGYHIGWNRQRGIYTWKDAPKEQGKTDEPQREKRGGEKAPA